MGIYWLPLTRKQYTALLRDYKAQHCPRFPLSYIVVLEQIEYASELCFGGSFWWCENSGRIPLDRLCDTTKGVAV